MEVDSCPVCDPVQRVVEHLLARRFHIVDQRISDPHFKQVYIYLRGLPCDDLPAAPDMVRVENKYICDCHWSTVEFDVER